MLPCHDEELANHAAAFANVLLHQLGTRHADELAVGVMRHRSGQQGLAGAGRTVEQDALWLCDTKRLEQLWMFEAQLDDLFDLLDLLIQTTNHVVSAVWDLFDHHEGYERVDGRGEHLFEFVGVREERYALACCELGDVDRVGNIDN